MCEINRSDMKSRAGKLAANRERFTQIKHSQALSGQYGCTVCDHRVTLVIATLINVVQIPIDHRNENIVHLKTNAVVNEMSNYLR